MSTIEDSLSLSEPAEEPIKSLELSEQDYAMVAFNRMEDANADRPRGWGDLYIETPEFKRCKETVRRLGTLLGMDTDRETSTVIARGELAGVARWITYNPGKLEARDIQSIIEIAPFKKTHPDLYKFFLEGLAGAIDELTEGLEKDEHPPHTRALLKMSERIGDFYKTSVEQGAKHAATHHDIERLRDLLSHNVWTYEERENFKKTIRPLLVKQNGHSS